MIVLKLLTEQDLVRDDSARYVGRRGCQHLAHPMRPRSRVILTGLPIRPTAKQRDEAGNERLVSKSEYPKELLTSIVRYIART